METRKQSASRPALGSRSTGFSLIEVLCVIAIIGVLTGVAIPIIKGMNRVSVAKSKRNAQMTVELSSNLTALDIAHVLPKSLGGAGATTRLLKGGVTIPNGQMEGAELGMQNLPEDEIDETARFIQVVSDDAGLHLQYAPNPKE